MVMQFPQDSIPSTFKRQVSTSNLDELIKFQANKNRHYTQLQTGQLTSKYTEINLEHVQIFKENLNVGARIEASPAKFYLPFAFILPSSGDYRFCGHKGFKNTLIQASGGIWDVTFNNNLDYVCSAFKRSYFYENYELLTGQTVPDQYLESKAVQTSFHGLSNYAVGINNILNYLHAFSAISAPEKIERLLTSQVLKLTVDALQPTISFNENLKPHPQRIRGTQRVIDYLQVHADQLPDMQTLCKVAHLSERSLEYGFKEYLGVTPISYLRIVRLNGARLELLQKNHQQNKVADIAFNWGFLELGRFAREYKQLFQELPSQTLILRFS